MNGPYQTERQASDDSAEVYGAMRTRVGDMQLLNVAVLQDACRAAGVELGGYDHLVLRWLAGFEPQQAQVIAGIIRRAATV